MTKWNICYWLTILLIAIEPASVFAKNRKTEMLTRMGETKICQRTPGLAGWLLGGKQIWSLERVLSNKTDSRAVQAIVVGFFGTWCEPCRKGLKLLQKEAERTERQKVVFILVAIPPFDKPVGKYLKSINVTLPTIKDKFGAIWERWTKRRTDKMYSENLPRTAIINSEQMLIGAFGTEGRDYETVIRSALKNLSSQCKAQETEKEKK